MYSLRLALNSILQTPILSGLIVGAIALGIGVFMTLLTSYHLLERDPLPGKSNSVYRVLVDAWGPDDSPNGGVWRQDEPPFLMTYLDAVNLVKSDIPTNQAAMFASVMYLKPVDDQHIIQRPLQVRARVTFGGFFPMFDTPFLYGSGWDKAVDAGPEPVVVINKSINQKVFNGANSVGETILLDSKPFRVVGVLDTWQPMPLFYNFFTLGFGAGSPEEVFIPFHFFERYELSNLGADFGWKPYEPGFENRLLSESTWLQFWVQLDNEEQKQRYLNYLDSYAIEQRKQGRFARPLNNRLYDVRQWIDAVTYPLNGPSLAFLVLGLLYLFVCVVNLISMLLAKFLGRMQEICIRRALGATQFEIFLQHLLEVTVLGIFGGLIGIALSQSVLEIIQTTFKLEDNLFILDAQLIIIALCLSLIAGLAAGILPAWRACTAPPVTYLKSE